MRKLLTLLLLALALSACTSTISPQAKIPDQLNEASPTPQLNQQADLETQLKTTNNSRMDQNNTPTPSSQAPQVQVPQEQTPQEPVVPQGALIKTSIGDITVKLFPKQTPKTVANFVGLSTGQKNWIHPETGQKQSTPLYSGTIFHRVIKDFMIQGGDPLGTGTGGPGYQFEDEIVDSLKFDKPYLLAMANSGPDTNGSQFFITLAATPWLNGKHTIFGQVTKGQEVVDKIGQSETNSQDKPLQDITINQIRIIAQ